MNETAVYTKEYFIEKLSAIPDENWIANGDYYDKNNPQRGCLLYHLGVGVNENYTPTVEALALTEMIDSNLKKLAKKIEICEKIVEKYDELIDGEDDKLTLAYAINDTCHTYNKTPKQAIIECLELI